MKMIPFRSLLTAACLFQSLITAHAIDSNHDGMEDEWQVRYNIAPFTGAVDLDGDGLPNLVEAINWSDPRNPSNGFVGWGNVWITDQDNDVLDDAWEAQHAREGMTVLPYEDPDGDGRTNLEESIVGTDPWTADAVGSAVANQATGVASSVGALNLHLPATVPAVRYRLQRSDDLVNWSFDASPEAMFWGDHASYAISVPLTTETHLFCRWVIDDPDDDADTLSGYAEQLLGTSDQSADSDGDGVPDAWEAKVGTNPLVNDAGLDSDSDGKTNLQEYQAGTNPMDFYNGGNVTLVSRMGSFKKVTRNFQGLGAILPLNGGSTPPRYFKRKVTEVKESLNYTNVDDTDWAGGSPPYALHNDLNYQFRKFERTTQVWDPMADHTSYVYEGASVQRATRYRLRDWYDTFGGTPTHDEYTAHEDVIRKLINGVTTTIYSNTDNGGIQHSFYFNAASPNPINILPGTATAVAMSDPATQSITVQARSGHPAAVNSTGTETILGQSYTKTAHWEYQYRGAMFDAEQMLADPIGYQPNEGDAEDVAKRTTNTLSDEFTETEFIAITNTLLDQQAWSAFEASTSTAQWTFLNRNTASESITRQKLKYKFTLKRTPQVKLTWTETFVPSAGGASTVNTKSWTGYNVVESPEFNLDATAIGTWTVSTPTVVQDPLKAELDVFSTPDQTKADADVGALLPRDASNKCQTRIVLRAIHPLSALGVQKLYTWSAGVRIWKDSAGTIPVTTSTVFPADIETTLYADPDPAASAATTAATKTVSLQWNGAVALGAKFSSITLAPVVAKHIDRLVVGTLPVLGSNTGYEFVDADGQVLAHYDNVGAAMQGSGSGTNFRIYNSLEEVFNDTELDAIRNNAVDPLSFDSRVVFYRDGTSLAYMVLFNNLGTAKIRLLQGSTQLSETPVILNADDQTYHTIVHLVRSLTQDTHVPVLETLVDANDPYEDSGDDEDDVLPLPAPEGPTLGIMATGGSVSTEAMDAYPAQPMGNVPSNLRDRVANIVIKLLGPMVKANFAPLADQDWFETQKKQWHLRMLFTTGFSEGFCEAIEGEISDLAHAAQLGLEFQYLTSNPIALLKRGAELYRSLKELKADIEYAGGMKAYVQKTIQGVKSEVESAFDWLNTGYVSDENDAFILGYASGYGTEQIVIGFILSNEFTEGKSICFKAIRAIKEGAQSLYLLQPRIKFKIRMLFWSLNYGRVLQVQAGLTDSYKVYAEVRKIGRTLSEFARDASMYGTAGGAAEVVAARYKRVDQLAQQFAKLSRLPDGTRDLLPVRFALRELGDLSEAMGVNAIDALSDQGARGFARLSHSMILRDPAGGATIHSSGIRAVRNYLAGVADYTAIPPVGSVSKVEADALFALFDEGGNFALEADGLTWVYKGTLRYGSIIKQGRLADEQHRIAHVLHHIIEDATRASPHGVFTVPPSQVFDLLHEVRMQGIPDGKDFEHIFTDFVGIAENTPGGALPKIPYQPTKKVRLGMKSLGSNEVLTGFPKN